MSEVLKRNYERSIQLDNDKDFIKPAQKKCAGFSRLIDRTTYIVSCFHGTSATETLESKINRLVEKDIKAS